MKLNVCKESQSQIPLLGLLLTFLNGQFLRLTPGYDKYTSEYCWSRKRTLITLNVIPTASPTSCVKGTERLKHSLVNHTYKQTIIVNTVQVTNI